MLTIEVTMEDSDGLKSVVSMPAHWVICSACSGEGKSSAYLGAYGREEFDEAFSPKEQEDYFAGAYDRPCEHCRGTGKVKVVDEGATLSPEQVEALRYMKARAEEDYTDWRMHCAERGF